MGHVPADVWAKVAPLLTRVDREVPIVIWKDGSFDELANLHPEPEKAITFTEADKLRLQDNKNVLVLLHNHPSGNPEPSDADSAGQMAMGVPWGVCAVQSAYMSPVGATEGYRIPTGISPPECWGDDVEIPPLVGRSYLWQVRDCFTLVRDYYRLQGISLPNAARSRSPGFYPLSDARSRPFTKWAPLCGFEAINWRDRKPGDTIVMEFPDYGDPHRVNWPREEPNHCAIYFGEGKYLHQLRDHPSDYWTPKNEDLLPTNLKAIVYRLKVKNARSRRPLRGS
ncbi:hypothetical protein D3C72_968270 [compost metagenome]